MPKFILILGPQAVGKMTVGQELEKITGLDQSWIQGILKSKTNLGKIPYKGELYDGRHKAIITEEEYQELEKIDQKRRKNKNASHYLLSGKIYCGNCGAKYRYQKWGKKVICYCYSQQKSKPKYIKNPHCNNTRYPSEVIENHFLEQLFQMSLKEEEFKNTFPLSEINKEEELTHRLKKIEKRIYNLIHLLSKDFKQLEVQEELKKQYLEKEKIEKELQFTKKAKKETSSNIKNLSRLWEHLELEEKRNIIEELLDKIIVEENTLKIYWNISS